MCVFITNWITSIDFSSSILYGIKLESEAASIEKKKYEDFSEFNPVIKYSLFNRTIFARLICAQIVQGRSVDAHIRLKNIIILLKSQFYISIILGKSPVWFLYFSLQIVFGMLSVIFFYWFSAQICIVPFDFIKRFEHFYYSQKLFELKINLDFF